MIPSHCMKENIVLEKNFTRIIYVIILEKNNLTRIIYVINVIIIYTTK